MRPDAVRAVTARSARSRKLSTRLCKGEKRDRKRMADPPSTTWRPIPAARATSSPSACPPRRTTPATAATALAAVMGAGKGTTKGLRRSHRRSA